MIIVVQTLIYFRQSLLAAIDRALQPYYKRLTLVFSKNEEDSEEEDSDDQVYSDFDDEKGVVFYPPVYAQRYAAVSDCLMDERWKGHLEKVVDFGYHDMSFIKYLKEVPGIQHILGVDLESIPLKCSSDVFDDYTPRREGPLHITLFQGNAADPDYRLIGCDAVIAIEMIEHMLPHDLDRFVHTVFGFIKPWIVVLTTPNGDFNVLFKSLEKNGLRRWDHFFEWSRVQFNDWCSNIVTRYPLYTVSYKGIGPGPPGTLHYGCCSQLALFINKEYHKQQDLNLNSLAIVQRQSPKPLNDLYESWDNNVQEMDAICPPTSMVSFTDVLCNENQSQLTFMVSPSLSNSSPYCAICPKEIENLSNSDKISQCNLDTEIAKSFIMFDEDLHFDVRTPRRRIYNRVYEIEDVASRLNCSTFQVKKFSKKTQNLMAKNKIDSLMHTREVVDEIRHLTKTLNINKCIINQSDGTNIWCNINWGENAPYWNQYYKVVKEFNCPFETKSEECRILDLVSDEINHIIDLKFDEVTSCEANRVEIPLNHLMTVVEHITDDVDKVRDILEWNGYEIVKDVVIHSRLVVDAASVATHEEDWQDDDTYSDWDNVTEVHSTTVSDSSMVALDYFDQRLRRALDLKVRNLRAMMTADEDITTELDKVVCKLMKLALRTSRERTTAPPAKWMQFKLLDLLTLTEKAIERRKKYYIKDSLKAIDFHVTNNKLQNIANLNNNQDHISNEIMDNYRHLISPPDLESYDTHSHSEVLVKATPSTVAIDSLQAPSEPKSLEPDISWFNVDIEVDPHCKQEMNEKTEIYTSDKQMQPSDIVMKQTETEICKASLGAGSNRHKIKREKNKKLREKTSATRVTKKMSLKTTANYNLVKNPSSQFRTDGDSYIARSKRRFKENICLTMRASKPIPESLIDLCHPELKAKRDNKVFSISDNTNKNNNSDISSLSGPVAVNRNQGIDKDKEETLDLCTNIGIDPDEEVNTSNYVFDSQYQEKPLINDMDLNLFTKHEVSTENIDSQPIFLTDINEPSTSKGVRHNVSMDVQCGPDALAAYPMLSASTSLVRIPPAFSAGLRILDVATPKIMDCADFGSSTQESEIDNFRTSRSKFIGIKIKDSDTNITTTDTHTFSVTQETSENRNPSIQSLQSLKLESVEATLQKQILLHRQSQQALISKNMSDILQTNSYVSKDSKTTTNNSEAEGSKPVLSCGGVYVHSYKEKQQCEDIVYQGEWQRYKSKTVKKKMHNCIIAKKINESCNKKLKDLKEKRILTKDKISAKKDEKAVPTKEIKKPLHIRNLKLYQTLQDKTTESMKFKSFATKKLKAPNAIRAPRSINNVTKVASKISMSAMATKNVKSALTAKKPQVAAISSKQKDKTRQNKHRVYTTLHKLNVQNTQICNKLVTKSTVSTDANFEIKKENSFRDGTTVISKTKKISKDLIHFSGIVPKNTYIVYRSDKQEDSTREESPLNTSSTEDLKKENIKCDKHTFSIPSLNSSTCSSPNSIATVRAATMKSKNASHRKCSSSSYKGGCNTSESENSTPSKAKRALKRYKIIKKSDTNNKENIPTATGNIACKEIESSVKSLHLSQQNSIAKVKSDRVNVQTMPGSVLKPQVFKKSNYKTLTPEYSVEKNLSLSNSSPRKRSLKFNTSSLSDNILSNQDIKSYGSLEHGNMVLVVQTQEKSIEQQYQSFLDDTGNVTDRFTIEHLQNHNFANEVNNSANIVKEFVEDFVDDLEFPNNVHSGAEDSKLALTSDDVHNNKTELNESSVSFKTVTTDSLSATFDDSDIESSLNNRFDKLIVANQSDINLIDTELKAHNLKPGTPVSNRSQYFMADNELKIGVALIKQTQTSSKALARSSITDIFERKEHCLIQVPQGLISTQAFSGFSFDGVPETGDKTDPVSLIDSETGSLAVDIDRLTTSEELLISGRSSDSYESCLIDDDAVVPNWLFEIISQHQPVEDDHLPFIGPQPEPIPQNIYDVNGNPIDPGIVGLAAGAGDGRGIHSDPSQDSSGRGTTTSLSSSDTSSNPLSEDIVADLSGFTAQFERLRDIAGLQVTEPRDENAEAERSRTLERMEGAEAIAVIGHNIQAQLNPFSDIDADVSSLDTDVPDSSEN